MTSTPENVNTHFDALVEHLRAFEGPRLRAIAGRYGAPSANPVKLARFWCREPENFIETLRHEIDDPQGWQVLSILVQDHDLSADLGWLNAGVHGFFSELGLLHPRPERFSEDDEIFIPGAIAAILAPHIERPTRVSLLLMLGSVGEGAVEHLMERYGIEGAGSRIENLLRLSDVFMEPGFPTRIMQLLDNPEWIGAAMMALEHGGVCYWREIFGFDPEEKPEQGDNVVPLIRQDDRAEQRLAAEALVDLGVLMPVNDPTLDSVLLAVPEELWFGLWETGVEWLSEWIQLCYQELEELAVGRPRGFSPSNTQAMMKWLYVEVIRDLTARDRWLDEDFLGRFRERITVDDIDPETAFSLARSLDLFHPEQPDICVEHGDGEGVCSGATSLLDLARPGFARRLLSDWVNGEIGARADIRLGEAVGLDAQWLERQHEVLRAREMPILDWMFSKGIPHLETGAGSLREIGENDEELILGETMMTHTCIRLSKLTWLDVLSMLEPGNWHSVAKLGDLLHYTAALSLSNMLIFVVESPHLSYYFPLQGPSMLTYPMHVDAFVDWSRDIITEILVPAGLAEFDAADERVWLDVKSLRMPTPPDLSSDVRVETMSKIFGGEPIEFEIPEDYGAPLRSVSDTPREDTLPADSPLATLMEATRGRKIAAFDGRVFTLAPE